MKRIIFLMLTAIILPLVTMAQSYDDLYYIPKKEKDKEKKKVVVPVEEKKEVNATCFNFKILCAFRVILKTYTYLFSVYLTTLFQNIIIIIIGKTAILALLGSL